MKQLLRKKWFRILLRTVVLTATLLAVAVSIFNWQAAARKQRAIVDAKAAGMALSARDLTGGMPPPDQNFARHGIFGLLEDGLQLPEEKRTARQREAIERYGALGDESLSRDLNRHRPNISGPIDFSFLPDDGSYGKTAGSFLAEYDHRHGPVLDEIRAAMALPHIRRTTLPGDFDDTGDWLQLNEAFGFTTVRVQRGLRLRAEAALAIGDTAAAAESIVMIARLAELTGSRGLLISAMIEFANYQTVKSLVKRGMDSGTWTTADLDRISAAVSRWDVRGRLISGASSEATLVLTLDAWKQDRARVAPYLAAEIFGAGMDDRPSFHSLIAARLLPGGVFDQAAASNLENLNRVIGMFRDPTPAGHWIEAADQLRNHRFREGPFSSILSGTAGSAAMIDLGSRALIRRHLILAACAIERHRLITGSCPDSLSEIAPEIAMDPFLGVPLEYERMEKSFRLSTPGPFGKPTTGKTDPRAKDWTW